MALSSRGLCVVLTLWMVCTRPSASIWPGSSVPGSSWEAKELAVIRAAARKLRASGDLTGLKSLYQKGLDFARSERDIRGQILLSIDLGNVALLSFRYTEAIAAYLQARDLAQSTADWENLGLITLNLSSLYQQVGDSNAALAAAEAGRAAVAKLGSAPYQAQLLLILGRLHMSLNDGQAEPLYLDAVESARRQNDATLEARAWDLLGIDRLERSDLDGAERAVVEGFLLRVLDRGPNLRFSHQYLGALRLAQARLPNEPGDRQAVLLDEAMLLTQRALLENQDSRSSLNAWLLLHQKGQIEEAQGRIAQALESYRAAVDEAALWWSSLPTADSTLTGANAALHHRLFDSFVEAAGDFAKRTQDPRLAAEAFLVEEFNRASSLRETQALESVWRSKLPPAYWETLAQLRAVDARSLNQEADPAQANRLRLKISEMETLAGLGFSLSKNENFRSLDSLTHFQRGLKQSELFLGFHLGPRQSYLWAVTRDSLRLYRLEAEDRIARRAAEFRRAVASNGSPGEIQKLGSELYAALFGQLLPEEAAHPAWLIAEEGPLFEVPFGALVRSAGREASSGGGNQQGKSEYLVERNSVQIVPGALLLRGRSGAPGASGGFLAVGDPVYNTADPRFVNHGFQPFWRSAATPASQLNRLVETRREVEASAQAWSGASAGGGSTTILTGASATRARFLQELQEFPAAIHLATHVLTPAQHPGQAFIAFSLDSTRQPELLATSDIGKLHVPGSLVVMSGCATAAGESLEGAGLLGLTRAWLMAGAAATLATAWPVEDSAGELLPSFYNYHRTVPAAEALRRSQVDMIHAGGWRAAPSYWAAYQVSGGER